MAPPNQTRNIAILGASGNVGAAIVKALLAKGHKVSAFSRPESKATFPEDVTVHKGDFTDESWVTSLLTGQDVLILATAVGTYDVQTPFIKAAAKAGVPYVLPCEFGTDHSSERMVDAIDYIVSSKTQYRKLIEDLGVSSYIAVANGLWLDFCLQRMGPVFGIDAKNKKATVFNGGTGRANATTLHRVGESLAALFALPEDELTAYKNKWVHLSSFSITQQDILASAARVTGTKVEEWTVDDLDANATIRRAKEDAAKGDFTAGAPGLIAATFHPENIGGDYNDKVVDYRRLGLAPEEDLDEVVKAALKV